MQRDAFLQRVSEAVARGNRHRPAVQREKIVPGAGYVGLGGDDPCEVMAREIAQVGGIAHRAADDEAAREVLRQLIAQHEVRRALCWQHPVLQELQLAALLESLGVELLDPEQLASLPEDQRRQQMLEADLGISSTTWAIAETGTLALVATPTTPRTASLLPPVHVAIVRRSQIIPDLFDFFEQLAGHGDEIPSNVTLITGPSKTGDLELRLVTGVHGPGQWHVVLVDEPTTPESTNR